MYSSHAGTLSLLTRELALPFVAVMSAFSIHERSMGRTLMWQLVSPYFSSWCFFILLSKGVSRSPTISMRWTLGHSGRMVVCARNDKNDIPIFFSCPSGLLPFLVPLTLLGLSGWRGPLGSRIGLTVGIYIFIFLFVGQEFNRYWGVVYVNLLPLGLLFTLTVAINLYDSIINSGEADELTDNRIVLVTICGAMVLRAKQYQRKREGTNHIKLCSPINLKMRNTANAKPFIKR